MRHRGRLNVITKSKGTWILPAIGLILFISVLSCGKKNPPVPPKLRVPKAIEDLSYYFDDGILVLKWSIPRENTDGSKLEDLEGFLVQRRHIHFSERDCASCGPSFKTVADIHMDHPKDAKIIGKIVEFIDRDTLYKHQYIYRVFSYNTHGEVSGSSNILKLNWDIPPIHPSTVNISSGNRLVSIRWEPYPEDFEGQKIIGYRVYRRLEGHSYPYTPVSDVPASDSYFEDKEVKNDITYIYTVRTVRDVDGTLIESNNSPEVKATPMDLVPPATPKDLVAVPHKWGIELRWEGNKEPDVLGYYIYRRSEGQSLSQRITNKVLTEVIYIDRTARMDHRYYYSVSAVDNSPHQNESPPSEEIRIDYVY